MSSLKPFVLNLDDLGFLYKQVTFRPLFDADGNAIVSWDGVGTVYDGHGALIGSGGTVAGDAASLTATRTFGTSYSSTTDLSGLRDVTGLNNNLLQVHSTWGAVDQPFLRTVQANYTAYIDSLAATDPNAFYGTSNFSPTLTLSTGPDRYAPTITGSGATATVTLQNVVDYTPRMISQTITTGSVTLLTEGDLPGYTGTTPNHIVYNTPLLSDGATANPNYDPAGIEGVAVVSNSGLLGTLGHVDYQKANADGTPDLTQPGSTEVFIGAENPGVAPTNGWFALFGQFFDHGLDFIDKSSGKTIKIALAEDDPLYGVAGPDGRPVTAITITRATPAGVDANGDAAYVNHSSPFIDQSQTYGSSAQVTNLVREWVSSDGNVTFHAGMKLFDGTTLATQWKRPDGTLTNDTLPTLSELRDHVLDTKRDALTWEDVANLRNRDASGHVVDGTSNQALLLDMNPRFDSAHLDSLQSVGTSTVDALIDAAVETLSTAVQGMTFSRSDTGGIELVVTGGAGGPFLPDGTYTGASALAPWVNFADFSITAPAGAVHDAVGQILMAAVGDHYLAGDGRVNENFGLTAIHHVFHEEHNFQIQNIQNTIIASDTASGDATHATLHQWQVDTGVMDTAGNFIHGVGGPIAWDQDKMFNAAKLVVEMEYQHVAIDQYARTVTPHILEVVGYSSGTDPTVSLEFSQAAFRFGHSTIRETIDTIDPTQGLTGKIMSFALEQAFLNPGLYAQTGPAAIALGMSHQQMNEVDEFITPALSQGLLGQPLDLGAINIARDRDLGIPTLNEFREKVGLTTYVSWDDFGRNMIHPESLVNFIAAYAFDGDVTKAAAIMGLYDGSLNDGDPAALGYTNAQATAFMLNDTTTPVAGADAFNTIDTWIGGLAEAHVPGGLLGSTFDLVFVNQMESLINGDRFYYLVRLFGQQFGEEVNNGQFKDIVERNTGLEHLNGSIFAYADKYYEFAAQDSNTAADSHKSEHKYGELLELNPTLGIWSDGSANPLSINGNGAIITVGGVQYIRDFRPDLAPDALHPVEGTPTSGAESHEVIVGTDRADYVHLRGGDDTFYGEGGNDRIFGDFGNDRLYGGDGADIIDSGDGADLVDGGAGDDTIYGFGSGTEIGGFDQLVGGSGNDTIYGGEGVDKLSGGAGDDALFGEGNTDPFTHGGDGNDYLDGGSSGDNLYGDAGDDFVYGGDDQDIVQGDSGDDILRPGKPSQAINGGPDEVIGGTGFVDDGFDIMDLSDWDAAPVGVTADLTTQQNPLVNIDGTTSMPAWFQMEGVITTRNNDTLVGNDTVVDAAAPINNVDGNNWLIGGSGNDTFTGAGGNDVIVGGSIRLDKLIGTYSGGYGNTLADGTSHRAIGAIGGDGLLDAAALGGAFDKHFTEMLRTERFKDLVLGDGGVDGTADLAILSGNTRDYAIVALDINGAVIANPLLAPASVFALRITDSVADRDGSDLVIGVERFQFADGTKTLAQLFNQAPTGSVSFTATENPGGVANNGNAVRLTATNTIADADGVATAVTYAWQNTAGVAIPTGTANNPYVDGQGRLVLHTTAGTLVNEVGTYTDGRGTVETVTKAWNMVVGTSGNNVALNGTTSTSVDDVIFGLDNTDVINAFAGNDRLYGGAGNDALNGGDGNDILDGGTGADTMIGGLGDDTYVVDDSTGGSFDVVTEFAGAGSGMDTVLSSVNYVLTANVENLTLTGNNDIGGTGNGLDNVLAGNAGNNTLNGGLGSDTYRIALNGGNDIIADTGGAADRIVIGTGGSALTNLSVSDSSNQRPGGNLVVSYNADQVTANGHFNGGNASSIELINFDNGSYAGFQLGSGDYVVSSADPAGATRTVSVAASTADNLLAGETGTDALTGGSGKDLLFGNGGSDTLFGGGGSDLLVGGSGNDLLSGGEANDTLIGGTGTDILNGGLGNDTFVFDDGHTGVGIGNRDIIIGFQAGDTIDFSQIDAVSGGADQNFVFTGGVGTGDFSAAGQLRYSAIDTDGQGGADSILIEGNVNNNLNTDLQIVLQGYTGPLSATDFIF